MIGISDPDRGARTVTANFKALADRRFITLEPAKGGLPPRVTLLDELGTGGPYSRADGKDHLSYFRIPETLWTSGAIGDLSGPGLAMYLVMLYYHRSDRPGVWLSPNYFSEHHGLSEGTRLHGINDLHEQGLISIEERIMDSAGTTENKMFPRRILRLNRKFLPPPAAEDPAVRTPDVFADPPPVEMPEYRPVEGIVQL